MSTEVYSSLAQFTSELYGQAVVNQTTEVNNVFISSISIYIALLMTFLGTEGETRTEMRKSLHIPSYLEGYKLHDSFGRTLLQNFVDSTDVNLTLANRFFVFQNAPVRRNFKWELGDIYSSSVEILPQCGDLENKREIVNNWVAAESKSKIPEFLPEGGVNADDVLTLVSAAHFEGLLKFPFANESTEDIPFVGLDGSEVHVPMLYLKERLPYEDLIYFAAEAIKIPFGSSLWELLIILPYEQNGLRDLLEEFQNKDVLSSILAKPFAKSKIYLHVPHFKLTETEPLDIKEMLVNMGMKSLFDETADFSNMFSDDLFLSDVKHKAMFKTDIESVMADTTDEVLVQSASTVATDIRVDHPFIVALIYNRTVPAFVGHVVNPEVV